jgi:hypothetical protein
MIKQEDDPVPRCTNLEIFYYNRLIKPPKTYTGCVKTIKNIKLNIPSLDKKKTYNLIANKLSICYDYINNKLQIFSIIAHNGKLFDKTLAEINKGMKYIEKKLVKLNDKKIKNKNNE